MSGAPVVGIDLGGTNMQIGVVDAGDQVLAHLRRKTKAAEGQKKVLDRLADGIAKVCKQADISVADLGAIGIAAPGAIDIPNGVVLEAPNLEWENTPLRTLLEERFEKPIVVDNDVNAAVWGEFQLGAGRGHPDLLGVWIGTGVGGGLVLDGRIYHGPLFTAGEVGQTVLVPEGPPGRRVVEDFCSRSGMAEIIAERVKNRPSKVIEAITEKGGLITGSKKLARAVDAGDPVAREVVEHAAEMLGVVIANWVTVLAVDRVVLGGGISEALGEPFRERIRKRFRREVFPARNRVCELVPTELEDNAGLLAQRSWLGIAYRRVRVRCTAQCNFVQDSGAWPESASLARTPRWN